jgi:hypothetical protein
LEISVDHYYQNVKGWFNWPEMYKRAVAMAPELSLFVEIGCHLGKSTSCLGVEALNSGKQFVIYAIDIWDPNNKIYVPMEQFAKTVEPIVKASNGRVVIIPMRGDSGVLHKEFENECLDFVWVDGDHKYGPTLNDIRSWWPKLKYGGWMGGDDLIHGGVRQAVEEFFGPECQAGKNQEGFWIGNQSPSVYLGKPGDIRPTGGGWVWWARSKTKDWTPPGLVVKDGE